MSAIIQLGGMVCSPDKLLIGIIYGLFPDFANNDEHLSFHVLREEHKHARDVGTEI